jgi:hypothetical protein
MKIIKNFTSNNHNFLKQSYRYFLIAGLLIFVIFAGMNLLSNSYSEFRTTQAAGSDFSTFGKDSSTGSTTDTKPGNDVDWINSYSNSTNNVISSFDITNSIPIGTDFVGGSLKVPPAFTANFSTNSGTNYSTVEPSPANTVNNIKATGINVPNNANGQGQVQGFGPVLNSPAVTTSGGDGTFPIPFEHSSGNRVYTVYHHQPQEASFNINCVVVSDSSICPGYPKYFSTTNGSSNNGPHDISTAWLNNTETVGTKLYYAAQTNTSNGIGCFDIEAGNNCGYYALGSLPRYNSGAAVSVNNQFFSSQTGLVRSGDKLYTVGDSVQYYCFSITTLSACVGQPYNQATASNPGLPGKYGKNIEPLFTLNNKIYHTQNYNTYDVNFNIGAVTQSARISCFDVTTVSACAGFTELAVPDSVRVDARTGFSKAYGLYPIQNSLNQVTGICTTGRLEITNNTFCFNKDTGVSISVPPIFSGLPASSINTDLSYSVFYRTTIVRNKIYLPLITTGSIADLAPTTDIYKNGGVVCFDFITNARCAGFGNNGFVEPYTQGVKRIETPAVGTPYEVGPQTYGFSYTNGCMLGLGNQGILWSFNPDTGATPCTTSAAPSVVKPSGFYCDGGVHPTTWNRITIVDTFSTTNLTDVVTKVYDKNGIFLKQGSVLATNSSLSISDIPLGNSVSYNSLTGLNTTELQVETTGYGSAAGLAGLVGKRTVTSFNGDNPQVCFRTKVKNNFTAATVTNTANITNITPATTSASLTVIRPFDPAIDLPRFITLTGLICTPLTINAGGAIICSGTLPSNITPPNDLKLNIFGEIPSPCIFTLQSFTCNSIQAGSSVGKKAIQGRIGSDVPINTDKIVEVTGGGGVLIISNQSSSSKSSGSQIQSSSVLTKTVPELEKPFKSKIKITDPYICGVGSYGNVPDAKVSGVDFVYYDFYKDQSTSPSYSFKLKLNSLGDFFLPISKSTNIIIEGEYKVIYYANDSDGGKAQGEYAADISDNCQRENRPLVRSGGISVMVGTFFMLFLIGYFALQNHLERNKKFGNWKKM